MSVQGIYFPDAVLDFGEFDGSGVVVKREDLPAVAAHLLSLAETPIGDDHEQHYTVYGIFKVSGYGKARTRVATIIKMASEIALQFKNATVRWHGIIEVDPEGDVDVVLEQTL